MNQPFDPASFDPAALADPNFDQATLAQLAQSRPDLRQSIAAHPNCYPALKEWIAQQSPAAPAASAAESAQPVEPTQTADAGSAASAQQPGSAPSAQNPGYGAAPQQSPWGAPQGGPGAAGAQGQPAQGQPAQGQPGQPSAQGGAQQFTEGAKQMFGGAQQAFQGALGAQQKATGLGAILGWIPAVLAASALLCVICTFLPAARLNLGSYGGKQSVGYWDGGDGPLLLIMFLLTVAGGVLVFIKPELLWARIVAGVVGIVAAIFGFIDGFGVTSQLNDLNAAVSGFGGFGVKAGIGAILLGIISIIVILAAIAVIVPPSKISAIAGSNGAAGGPAAGGPAAGPYNGPAAGGPNNGPAAGGPAAGPGQNPYGPQQ
ncbi:MAG: hypothetical protein ACTII3_10955 [Galactobacter sp.]